MAWQCLEPQQPTKTTLPSSEESGLAERQPRVMVIDQSRTMRAVAKAMLVKTYEVIEADSGELALEMLASMHVEAIMCQGTLPGTTGIELWRQLVADPALRDVPVLLLAAEVDPELEKAARDAGAWAVLPKRFDSAKLLDTLGRALRAGESRNAG